MRTIKFLYIVVVIAITLTTTSCKKEGLGGKEQIKGHTYSVTNSKVLKASTIYIKYGATSMPGTDESKYDASYCSDSNGRFEFKELKKGDYYLYATAIDNGQFVSGGIRIILNDSEFKENIILTLAH